MKPFSNKAPKDKPFSNIRDLNKLTKTNKPMNKNSYYHFGCESKLSCVSV